MDNEVPRSVANSECEYEQELVEEARHDAQAFNQLYRLYMPRVYAYMAYRVGNAQDAEDLAAETFISAVRGMDSFRWRHEGSFAAWLFRIAHNLLANFYRDTARAGHPLPLDEMPNIPAHEGLPEDAALRKELFSQLYAMVNDLPARRREVVTLKYYAGLQNREIATVLDLDERTVASHLSRALDDLLKKYRATADFNTD